MIHYGDSVYSVLFEENRTSRTCAVSAGRPNRLPLVSGSTSALRSDKNHSPTLIPSIQWGK